MLKAYETGHFQGDLFCQVLNSFHMLSLFDIKNISQLHFTT